MAAQNLRSAKSQSWSAGSSCIQVYWLFATVSPRIVLGPVKGPEKLVRKRSFQPGSPQLTGLPRGRNTNSPSPQLDTTTTPLSKNG